MCVYYVKMFPGWVCYLSWKLLIASYVTLWIVLYMSTKPSVFPEHRQEKKQQLSKFDTVFK